ncbi:hypothetical protein FF098_008435 [Parvularcula flava]|uniref:Bacterial mobilisation domain-containing protein n=1 Tax=Aquisalinus luteolus TaxID=1566827 RepID=A0A8J3A3G2_9PROT|nr:hypothetical protein [Aquisalinus luteolus]NHK27927.1 hypothetical protein [Aquisalinus luteolus]GGH96948.1 hypothetical protein GCM10011355_16980 [Aquisalinus luteolus]
MTCHSFNQAAKPKKKRPAPISLRVSENERALLKELAGQRSVNAYVREKVFGDQETPRRSYRKPRSDEAAIGKALALLGQSRLSSNLNQIAKAANLGTLPVTPDLTDELASACADIRRMREELIAALGIKSQS